MENEPFETPIGMHLNPQPLIYLHEYFKKHNNPDQPHLQNNWVWYSLENLRAIVAKVEKLNDSALKKEGDGVRLYYGIYNEQVCKYLSDINPGIDYSNYKDHNTVFFVPTYKMDGEGERIDNISPETVKEQRENYNNDQDIPIDEIFEGGYNVGHICPPPRKCDNTGSNL